MELHTLDLGQFSTGSPAERAAIAQAFDGAFRTAGFCYLTGYEHLLPEATIDALRTQSMAFFALPAAEKEKSRVDGEIGYLGPGAENIAASAGAASAQPDLVESLNLPAYQEPPWHVSAAEAECPWRDEAWFPTAAFRAAAVAYFGGVNRVMMELYSLAEMALELPPATLGAAFEHPGTLLRLAWYPPCDEGAEGAEDAEGGAEGAEGGAEGGAERLRYGAHTDFDGFTILQRGEELRGGLEVQLPSGEWAAVAAPPNTLTINIGDLLQRWTNDRWSSTRHRVARDMTPGRGRLSLVYFTGPHPDTVVECLQAGKCAPADGGAPRYAPITAYEHVLAKMHAATADGREAASEQNTGADDPST